MRCEQVWKGCFRSRSALNKYIQNGMDSKDTLNMIIDIGRHGAVVFTAGAGTSSLEISTFTRSMGVPAD